MITELLTVNWTTILVFVSVFLLLFWYLRRDNSGLPPGPGILGSMLAMKGGDPRPAFRKLREQYGDIFTVYFGTMQVTVMNGYDVLKDAFVKHGDKFTDRPKMFLTDELGDGGKGVIFSSGHVWSEQRKLMLSTLREFGMGKNLMEMKIKEEVVAVVDAIQTERGQVMDFKKLITVAVSNVVCSMVFGKRFEYTDEKFSKFIDALDDNFKSMGSTQLVSLFPFLRHLPGDLFKVKRLHESGKMINDELIDPAVKEHIRDFDENNINDYIDSYIKSVRDTGETSSINYANLKKTINDLFIAGTESTATTIYWALLYFLHNPNVQEKCFKEINEKIGTSRLPSTRDKTGLPYLEATIMELQRHADISPLSGAHSPTEDLVFRGYSFKKGHAIFPNLHSVHRDPKVWENSDDFRPERFLDKEGKVVKPDELIPFFMGRRNCLGESLARMELFLFLSAMIQKFRFEKEEGVDTPPLSGVVGLTHSPLPFKCRAILRH
ncbi:cytochrome P450 2C23-like [Gigantopelta aegis]|uniref:cytochrome P450 2C23-like n=1 Tax=Gigantopelta aegis TaxID=1735272 RepID=UPI001B88E543|nr:cytochrome P450 2C23-like [Gigantopelta aegis]